MMKNYYLPHGSGDSKAWFWYQLDWGRLHCGLQVCT